LPLSPPLRDASNGTVIPHDNACILNDDFVIRRISKHHIVPDPKAPTGFKVSSMLISPSNTPNGGMSIDIKKAIEDAQLDPATYVTTPYWFGSVLINVGFLRSLTFKVGYDPTPVGVIGTPENPYHGEVWGTFSKGKQKQVLASSSWFTQIPNVDLHIQTA
jgi:hypothetical protein